MTPSAEKPPQPEAGLFAENGLPVPLLGVAYSGRLTGAAVELAVAQRFRNMEATPIEVTYLFPLPEEAAVCGLTITLGDRVIRSDIEEREKAFERYDAAMARGDGAFLLDQERPNIFQVSVGNLRPGEEAVVETRLSWMAAPDERGVRLMIPTTISPRYTSPTLPSNVRAEIERTTPPYAAVVSYGMTFTLTAEMASVIRNVESPSHPIRVSIDGTKATVTLSQREVMMDRDLVLVVETAEPHQPCALAAFDRGHDHLLLTLFPNPPALDKLAPRQVAFLVDCSGSMSGDSIDEARRAVDLCLRALAEGDRFQIIRFGSTTQFLSPDPEVFNQATLERAAAAVQSMDADLGGTEILPALQAVRKAWGKERFDLVVLTDGEVSNEADVLALAGQHRDLWRVFAFGIGAGCSEFLVRGLARETGGRCEFIYPGERIEPKVLRQFARMGTPHLNDIELDLGAKDAELAPAAVPPTFTGDAMVVSARLGKGKRFKEGATIKLSAKTSSGRVKWTTVVSRAADGGPIPLKWARERIRDLESGFGVPLGSRQQRGIPRHKQELLAVSTTYGVLCSETSFVAIEERSAEARTTAPAELRRVPVMITTGWHGRGRIMPSAPAAAMDSTGAFAPLALMDKQLSFREPPAPSRAGLMGRLGGLLAGPSEPVGFEAEAMPTFMRQRPAPPEIPWYLALLGFQRADGAFKFGEDLARWAGLGWDELQSWVSLVVPPGADAAAALATALAVLLLERRATGHEDEWRLAAQKARAWLSRRSFTAEGRDLLTWLDERIR